MTFLKSLPDDAGPANVFSRYPEVGYVNLYPAFRKQA